MISVGAVNWVASAGYKKSAGHTNTLSLGELTLLVVPVGTGSDRLDTFFHAET